jgi:DNA-binding NarL/FixJ family response regulator
MRVRVLLADDHQIVREGLGSLLEKQGDMEVVGEAGDGRTAVNLARMLQPAVVVMDLTMPELNGIEATRQIMAAAPGVKVIALSMHADKRFVIEVFRAGAVGYVLKESAFEEVAHAIHSVTSGQSYVSPAISGILIADCVSHSPAPLPSVFNVLTERERQVLQLLVEGKTTKRTAKILYVSVKTVETHRMHIMNKLDTHSIAELTKYAIREGLTPP